jgi:hypothetical protein
MKTRFHIYAPIITLGLLISSGSFAYPEIWKSCCKTETSTKKLKSVAKKQENQKQTLWQYVVIQIVQHQLRV